MPVTLWGKTLSCCISSIYIYIYIYIYTKYFHIIVILPERKSLGLTSSEEESLPDPDDKFLLSLLRYGEIKKDQVYQLGVQLRVESYDVDKVMRSRSDTAIQALEVCHVWQRQYPEESGNKKTARRILKTALEKCGLARAAKRLICKTRVNTYIGQCFNKINHILCIIYSFRGAEKPNCARGT